jgi:hypothetical protein
VVSRLQLRVGTLSDREECLGIDEGHERKTLYPWI